MNAMLRNDNGCDTSEEKETSLEKGYWAKNEVSLPDVLVAGKEVGRTRNTNAPRKLTATVETNAQMMEDQINGLSLLSFRIEAIPLVKLHNTSSVRIQNPTIWKKTITFVIMVENKTLCPIKRFAAKANATAAR